jgi:hypothetical protein
MTYLMTTWTPSLTGVEGGRSDVGRDARGGRQGGQRASPGLLLSTGDLQDLLDLGQLLS